MINKRHRHHPKNQNSHRSKPKEQKQVNISGIISVNTRGVGYLRSVEKTKPTGQLDREDIEIQNNNLNTALKGDTVSAVILPNQKNQRISGKVISI